jgi:hypothetical protein
MGVLGLLLSFGGGITTRNGVFGGVISIRGVPLWVFELHFNIETFQFIDDSRVVLLIFYINVEFTIMLN